LPEQFWQITYLKVLIVLLGLQRIKQVSREAFAHIDAISQVYIGDTSMIKLATCEEQVIES